MAYVIGSRVTLPTMPNVWDYATQSAMDTISAQQQADAEYKKMLMDNLLGPSMKALIDQTIDEFRKKNGRLPNAQELTSIIQGEMPVNPQNEAQGVTDYKQFTMEHPFKSAIGALINKFQGLGGNSSFPSPSVQTEQQTTNPSAPSAPSPIAMQTFDRLGAQTTDNYVIAQTPEGKTYKVPLAGLDENAIKELVRSGVTFPKAAPSYPPAPSTFGPTAQEGKAYVNQPKTKELKKKESQEKARKAYEIVRKGLFGLNSSNIM